ncbi:MAG: thymidine phosphorylase, partial [Clostridiaceae bacterium]
VGDKISLIVIPIVAALGITVAKLSGRGLGHTGGTIDKLEALPGFSTDLSLDQFINNVKQFGAAIAGQTGNLTPADKKFYALRDVTETVDSIPLIAASIMSKKLASGSDAIVLDVKTGEGAFMKDLADSRKLAHTMVEIGNHLGRKTVAVITDMNEPLGREIGNANEVVEAIDLLKGKKIPGLYDVALEIAGYMVWLGGVVNSHEEAKPLIEEVIASGKALAKFNEFIQSQGGDPAITENYNLLPQAKHQMEIKAESSGYVTGIKATEIGYAATHLGAGRLKKDDVLDYAAGIHLVKLVGDPVNVEDTLCILKYNEKDPEDSIKLVKAAYQIGQEAKPKADYIQDVVTE